MIHHLITAKSLSFDVEWPLTMIKVNFANDESELSDAKEDLKTLFTSSLREAYELGCTDSLSKVKRKHEKAGTVYASDTWEAGYHDALFDSEASIVKLTLSARKEEKV